MNEDATARRYDKSGTDLSGEPTAKRKGERGADDERREEDIRRYIEANKGKFSLEELTAELRKAGYRESDIQEALPSRMSISRWLPLGAAGVLAIALAGYVGAAYSFTWWPFGGVDVVPASIQTTTPSPLADDTSAWKTYRNEKYGFEMQYPNGWAAVEARAPGAPFRAYITLGPAASVESGGIMEVAVRNQTLDAYLGTVGPVSQSETIMGESTALSVQLTNDRESVVVMRDGLLYEVVVSPASRYRDVFARTQATFRFMKEESAVDTATWQTYRNEQYGFEVKYPPSLTAGQRAVNSVLGTVQQPISGIHIGPLIFVILENTAVQEKAHAYFDRYIKVAQGPIEDTRGPTIMCSLEQLPHPSLRIDVVICGGSGGQGLYALIKGGRQEVFVDGYSGPEASVKTPGAFRSNEEIKANLSTFKFIPSTSSGQGN